MRGVEICISPAVSRKPHSTQGRYIERRRHKSNREVEPERLLHLLPREVVVVVVAGGHPRNRSMKFLAGFVQKNPSRKCREGKGKAE